MLLLNHSAKINLIFCFVFYLNEITDCFEEFFKAFLTDQVILAINFGRVHFRQLKDDWLID